jgi:hypothetical protein
MFGDDRWTDYDFEAEFMELVGPSDISLVVRCTGLDDHLRFAVTETGGRDGWKYSLIEASESGAMPRWQRGVGYPIVSQKWYSARVRVRGNHITSSLLDGGKEVVHIEFDDDKHPMGRVGFRTRFASYKMKNIRVVDPAGRTLWKGPPSLGTAAGSTDGSPPNLSEAKNPLAGGPSVPPGRDLREEVLGLWLQTGGPHVNGKFTLFSDGTVWNDRKQAGTWSLSGSTLTLRWPNPKAPGGAWVDTVNVTPDGRHYFGKNRKSNSIVGIRPPGVSR